MHSHFHDQNPARMQQQRTLSKQAIVERQTVRTTIEGGKRLKCPDFPWQAIALLRRNIRWIRDNDRHLARKRAGGQRFEIFAPEKSYPIGHAVTLRVLAGHLQGRGTAIRSRDGGAGAVQSQRNGQAARPRSHVHHVTVDRRKARGQDFLDDQLGFRPGNQHARVHEKVASAKSLGPHDILQGFP